MSTPFDKTNRLTFSKNKNKAKESDPDVKGSGNFQGVEFWFAGWLKQNADGAFYSASLTPKEPKQAAPVAAKPSTLAEMDDDIPW